METETRQIHNFHEGDRFHEHYRLLEHVGTGGFADVWKAKDELVDTIVALKIYTRLDLEGISELAKEYKEMKGVKHPNLLTGNHFDASGNIPYLVMDYCDGGSLFGKIGKMTNQELRSMVGDVVGGLAYLHSKGIVHQDIKPENILYDSVSGLYLLSDFGISSKSRTRLSKSVNKANMSLSMTEAYAPPEKFSGNIDDLVPDVKGDIFSLGMTIFELAVGQLPFEPPMATGREMLYSQGRLKLDYSKIKDLKLRAIVERCTQYDKESRPTANEVMEMLGSNGSKHDEKTEQTTDDKDPEIKRQDGKKTEKIKRQDEKKTEEIKRSEEPLEKDSHKSRGKSIYLIMAIIVSAVIFICLYSPYIFHSGIKKVRVNDYMSIRMIKVKGGTLWGGEFSGFTIGDFYMGETEVTQRQWDAVMGTNTSYEKDNDMPVTDISYKDILAFIEKLNNLTGKTFRLPTEEEWEFAARGGRISHAYLYSGSDNLDEVGWYKDNYSEYYYGVANKKPNELGLYDMSGGVWEWCNSSGEYTSMLRGGGTTSSSERCMVTSRINPSRIPSPHRGFRLAMNAY